MLLWIEENTQIVPIPTTQKKMCNLEVLSTFVSFSGQVSDVLIDGLFEILWHNFIFFWQQI